MIRILHLAVIVIYSQLELISTLAGAPFQALKANYLILESSSVC